MRRPSLCLLLLVCVLLPAKAALAEDLGRLFFTPEQRHMLDARRKARTPDRAAATVNASPTMRLDGYVKRSGGRSTVWVNGESVDDSAPPAGGSDARVGVTVGESRSRVELKPGEVLDRGNGEVRDVLGDGAIRIHRGATPK
jgi:hypothetical protein